MKQVSHGLVIEMVDYFQSGRGNQAVPHRHWDALPSRLETSTANALKLLQKHQTKASFLVSEWVAKRYPELVARVALDGHEILAAVGPDENANSTIATVEAASHYKVSGASIHDDAVVDDLETESLAFKVIKGRKTSRKSQFTEVAEVADGGYSGSGEWLRFIPSAFFGRATASWTKIKTPGVIDLKLWEFDADAPTLSNLSAFGRLRTTYNRALLQERLGKLLEHASFEPLGRRFNIEPKRLAQPIQATAAGAPLSSSAATNPPKAEEVTIIVPCFNEQLGLNYLANRLDTLQRDFGQRHKLSFVVVDDGSTDQTWRELQRHFGSDECFRLVKHSENRGIAGAILTGIGEASTDIVAVMDSDCSYDPAEIEKMLPLLDSETAMVTASPYHPDGGVEGVPAWRLVLSKTASALYRRVLSNRLATYTSCFRVMRRDAVVGMRLENERYLGVVEMLVQLDFEGWRIAEHPTMLESRLLGHSKLRTIRVIGDHLRYLGKVAGHKLAQGSSRHRRQEKVVGKVVQ